MNRPLRRALKILKYAAIAFGVLVLALAGVLWWGSIDKVDTVYIPKADFRAATFDLDRSFTDEETQKATLNFQDLQEPYFMSNYHWLKAGNKTMLVFRTYSAGLIFVMDDERFTQLTIALPSIQEGAYQIDGNQVRALYSSGGSAWPERQCGARIENGTLQISNVRNGRLSARIDFDTVCSNKLFKREKKVSFHQENDFSELSFENATSWHGKKGSHVYRETYR